ncbi:MAG: metal-dependent phosphoesterase [Verrucomicrobia bacterium]|nr:MAG: metal-dependent phosphoesterase [Verrucomicrobiota bacterium]
MPFNIDLHTHSFFSGDGISSPEDLIAAGRAKGLHGLAITDHNTCDAITYLLEKGLMRLDGQPVDNFIVLPGVEITTADGHLLCIGAELPYLKGKPAREVCEIIHERGGLAIPPHPYDLFRAGIRLSTLETLPIDAIEVFNAAATVGTAYTIVNTDDFSVKGILAQILKSNELTQKYQTPRDSLRKTWNNWLRLRRRKRIPELAAKDRSHNGD